MLDNPGSPTTWWQLLEPSAGSDRDDFDVLELFRTQPKIKNVRTIRCVSLFLTDVIGLILASFLAYLFSLQARLYIGTDPSLSLIPDSKLVQFSIFLLPLLLVVWNSIQADNYRTFKPLWLEVREYLGSIVFSAAATAIVLFIINGHFSRILFCSFMVIAAILLPLTRCLCKAALHNLDYWYVPAAIFGTGAGAKKLLETIEENNWMGLKVVAFISTTESADDGVHVPAGMVIKSTNDDRYETLKYGQPHVLFAPETQDEYEEYRLLINHVNSVSKTVTIAPPFYGLPLGGAEILHLPRSDAMLLSLKNNVVKLENILIKRLFDLVVASLVFVLTLPIFLIVCILQKIEGGPIFFRQSRLGRNNNMFQCLKFRTMVVDADAVLDQHLKDNPKARQEWNQTFKLKNDPRVTRLGKILRKTSLDELPQLINVLKNEMGLVGPRPIVVDEKSRYGKMLPFYMSINPGITGLWQISGRSNTTYEERVELDVWYTRNWSFWLDMVILAKTIPAILRSDGAY